MALKAAVPTAFLQIRFLLPLPFQRIDLNISFCWALMPCNGYLSFRSWQADTAHGALLFLAAWDLRGIRDTWPSCPPPRPLLHPGNPGYGNGVPPLRPSAQSQPSSSQRWIQLGDQTKTVLEILFSEGTAPSEGEQPRRHAARG